MKKSKSLLACVLAMFSLTMAACEKGNKPNDTPNTPVDPTPGPGGDTDPVDKTVKVTGITVIANKTTAKVSEGATVTVNVLPENATNKGYTLSTSDPSIATVANDGKVSAKKAGAVKVIATANDGSGVKGEVTITFEADPVAPVHECESQCPLCGNCTNADCTDPVCAVKCEGHGGPVVAEVPVFEKTLPATIEIEDALIGGTMTGTDPTDSFIGERNSDNPDHATSGGKVVFNWAAAGNTASFKLKTANAVSNAQIKLWATCAFSQNSSGLELKVNGAVVDWAESKVNGKGNENKWYYWNEINTSADLIAGENLFELTNKSGESWNLDCIEIKEYVAPTHFCNHICEYCGNCTDFACADEACAKKCAGHTFATFTDGRYRVPDSNKAGDYQIFVAEAKTVRVEFKANFTDTDLYDGVHHNDNNAVEMYINEQKDSNDKKNFGTSDGLANAGWKIYSTGGTYSLKKGANTLKVLVPYQSHVEYEYFEIVDDSVPAHTCSHACADCGKCTDFTCIYYECASNRCGGHNHECGHVCEYCGKCADTTCENPACAEKCPGHITLDLSSGSMIFESEDGFNFNGCTSYENAAASGGKGVGGNWSTGASYKFEVVVPDEVKVIFAAKGAVVTPLTTNNNGLCEIHIDGGANHENIGYNDWSGDANGWHTYKEFVGTKVATLSKGLHTITVIAPYQCMGNIDYVKIMAAPHVCAHECEYCGKCADATCEDPTCAAKCPGHKTLDLSSGSMIFESEEGFGYSGCTVYDNAAASGGKGVGGNWSTGTSYKFDFVVTEEVKVTFNARGSVVTPLTTNDNGLCEIHIDGGANLENLGSKDWSGDANGWHTYKEFAGSKEVTLAAGYHVIEVIAPYQCMGNIDYVKLVKKVAPKAWLTLECEDGVIAGTMTGTGADDSFIGARTSDNPDHATSGGRVVMNWGAAGNTCTLTFNSSAARENAPIKLWATANGDFSTSNIEMKVNGTAVSFAESVVIGKGFSENKWHFYNAVTTTANIVEGTNTIVIKNLVNEGINLDAIDVEMPEGTTFALAHVCKHVCPKCNGCLDTACEDPACATKCSCPEYDQFVDGVLRVEAETGTLSGCSIMETNGTDGLSSDKGVGDFNFAAGSKITLKVNIENAGNYNIRIRYACGMENNYNGAVELKVNDVKVNGDSGHDGNNFGVLTDWRNFQISNSLTTVALNAGENAITLEAPYGSYSNIDYVEIVVVA